MRGGAFNNTEDNLRSAYRNNNIPSNRNNTYSFRCVEDAERDAGIRIFFNTRSEHIIVQSLFLSCSCR